MKKIKFNTKNIIIICFLILLVALSFVILNRNDEPKSNNNFEDNIYDSSNDSNKNVSNSITLENSKLNEKLKKYLYNTYEVSINKINNNYIFGDVHDTSKNNDLFVTKYIFKYNFINDDFKIYEFNSDYRILNYFIINDTIYAALIFKNPEDNISYKWSIVKFENNLKNGEILKEGTILEPISTPVFHFSNSNNTLYVVAVNDTFTSENDIITSRKQDLNIYKIENSSITTLKSYAGDHMNQKGTMLCSIFEVQIYDDQLLICTTDFINTQDIRTINLNTKEENKIFTNNLHDGWIITSFQRNEQGIYVGKINSSNSQAGKTIFLNFETNKIQETDSSALYGRTPFISNKMLFHHLEKWSIYNVNDNKFYNVQIYGKDKDTYIYPTFYVLNENTILLKGTNNHFYNGILKLN